MNKYVSSTWLSLLDGKENLTGKRAAGYTETNKPLEYMPGRKEMSSSTRETFPGI